MSQANTERSHTAAAHTSARITAALHHLGDTVPADLAYTAQLRLHYSAASLTELGALSNPPISKDIIAGRLRRLLSLAEHHTG